VSRYIWITGLQLLTVYSDPQVAGGEPVLIGTLGTRVTDLLDRIDAGDSIEDVAKDFSVEPSSLELLVELRDALTAPTQPAVQEAS